MSSPVSHSKVSDSLILSTSSTENQSSILHGIVPQSEHQMNKTIKSQTIDVSKANTITQVISTRYNEVELLRATSLTFNNNATNPEISHMENVTYSQTFFSTPKETSVFS